MNNILDHYKLKIFQYLQHPDAALIKEFWGKFGRDKGIPIFITERSFTKCPFWVADYRFYFNEYIGREIKNYDRILTSLGYDWDKGENDPVNVEAQEWIDYLEELDDTTHERHSSFRFGGGCGSVSYPRYF